MTPGLIFILALTHILVFGSFTGYLARSKGYSFAAWFWLGAAFSVVALICMAGMPVTTPEEDSGD